MNPIELLMDEHRLIERVIDALIGYVKAVEGGSGGTKDDLRAFVAFIRGFADAHHHGKEEEILFRAMADQGMPADAGPLAVMLYEHVEGRGFAGALAEVAERGGDFGEADRGEVARAARGYAGLLRDHIQKEDQILYPMADQMLPESAWRGIEQAFDAFEADAENAARARELRASAEALVAKYA